MPERTRRKDDPPPGDEVPDTAFPEEGLTAHVEKKEDRLNPQGSPDPEERATEE